MDPSLQTRCRRAVKDGLEVGAAVKLSGRRMSQEDALTPDWGCLRGLQLEIVKFRIKNDPSGGCLW